MTELLENAELRVRIANNGEEALRAVAEKIPDCVLMDCQMPVMDGYEATRRLRQDPRYRDLPIIAITANAMASDRERCITAGMNAHIAKPINIPEMFETLAKWMKPVARVAAPLTRNLEAISEITELPVLPGIDAAVGLTQVGGRIPLYCKVLKKFRDNQGRRFEAEFRHLVASGAWADATRMAHSIKGVSRTLGAHNLGELAADLEAASRDQDLAPVEASLARLLAEMARVMVGLERIM
jgi:CheY-like chemotaxis protein/HPt (histidine-containing phosphotransfer) domain-containing protein